MIDRLLSRFSARAKRRKRRDAAGVPAAIVRSVASRAVAVPGVRESEAAFSRELERARRYERPLSVVVLRTFGGPPTRPEPAGSGMNGRTILLETRIPYLASLLVGSILTRALRESDLVAYSVADDRFVILLPEAAKADADRAVARLHRVLHERMRVGVRAGVAAFPEDGLTMTELVEGAAEASRRQPGGMTGLVSVGVADRNGGER